jgi:hypothetical protein
VGHDTGEYTTIWGQDLGATLVEKVHEDLPNYARNCSCSHPTTPLKTSVLTPTKCSKITFFAPNYFPQKTTPQNDDDFQNYFSRLENGAETPPKTMEKGASRTQKRTTNLGEKCGRASAKPQKPCPDYFQDDFYDDF